MEVHPLAINATAVLVIITIRRPYVSAKAEVARGPAAVHPRMISTDHVRQRSLPKPRADIANVQLTSPYDALNWTWRREKDAIGAVVRYVSKK